jgi:hypothetical protein
MASTTAAHPAALEVKQSPAPPQKPLPWTLILPLLTAVMLAVNGFHPLAEDGGLYVAGIEYQLDPTLFPHYTAFVTEHLRFSAFSPLMTTAVKLTHLPLPWALLLGYIFSLWLTLYAGLLILRRCTPNRLAQLSGVALLSVWSTLPVAGTSLLLVDPYLTARSFSTPLSLIAIAFALDTWNQKTSNGRRSLALCVLCLVCAILMHPLMAAHALAIVILLRILRSRHAWPLCLALSLTALAAAAAVHRLAPADSSAAIAASLSRYYWFLSQWQWFELLGLLGPAAILLLLFRRSANPSPPSRLLIKTALIAGTLATLIALCFAHKNSSTYLIARLQPLRVFLLIYAVMTLLLGAEACEWSSKFAKRLKPHTAALAIPAALIILSGLALFSAQHATFPSSQHIEWPWSQPVNPWSQAFVWIRNNTPRDALFALDADYITTDGEDAQTFRATSLRSAVPDFSKDGGEASITPSLAPLWQQSIAAQFAVQAGTQLIEHSSLSKQHDAERDAHLRPLGVTWVVLHADAATSHPCPYNNGTVKVCRIG